MEMFFFFPTSNHRLCSQRQVDTIITKQEPGSQFSDDSDIRAEAGEKDVHSPPLGLDRGRMTQSEHEHRWSVILMEVCVHSLCVSVVIYLCFRGSNVLSRAFDDLYFKVSVRVRFKLILDMKGIRLQFVRYYCDIVSLIVSPGPRVTVFFFTLCFYCRERTGNAGREEMACNEGPRLNSAFKPTAVNLYLSHTK